MKYIKILLFTFVFAVLFSLPVFCAEVGRYSYISNSGTDYTNVFLSDNSIDGFYTATFTDNTRLGYCLVSSSPFSFTVEQRYNNDTLYRTLGPYNGRLQTSGSLAGYYCFASDELCTLTSEPTFVCSYSEFGQKVGEFFFSTANGDNNGTNDGENDGNIDATTEPISDSPTDSEQSTNFGDWFNSIFSGLSDIVNSLKTGFQSLLEGIGKFFDNLIENIKKFFDDLLQGIMHIFIPDTEVLQGYLDEIVACFQNTFGFSAFDISSVVGSETAFDNIEGAINYGQFEFNGVVVEFSWVLKALATFKPYIRAFIAFLIIIYNINQFLGIIGSRDLTLGTILILNSADNQKNNDNK